MIQRLFTLTGYFLRMLVFSLTGIFYVLAMLAFWQIFFDPSQGTPDGDYYVLVTALFGAGLTFLVTLSVSARANQAVNYPLLVRLPSRVEHLVAVLGCSLLFSLTLQMTLAFLALFRGPQLTVGLVIDIPPIWVSVNVLAAVLALHATDLVTAGWSRVYVYGVLAVFLFGQSTTMTTVDWLTGRVNSLSTYFFQRGWDGSGGAAGRLANWLATNGLEAFHNLFGIPFWPLKSINQAMITGFFDTSQALGPAVLLFYATILFLLAADWFARKDLFLTE